jgi:hypothetical protein
MPDNPTPVLLLCRDLLFTSKVTATARAIAIPLEVVRDPAQLPPAGQRLIVDLNHPGALEAAAAWKTATSGHVTGFVSHVDTATIDQAKSAGFDQILPRSRFVQTLEDVLRGR